MSQFPHDEFAKEYLPELCQDYGVVFPSADVMSEKREIDFLFTPTKPVPTTPETLGLLGKLTQTTCMIEVYRNAVNSEQIKDCLSKLITVQQNNLKSAKKEGKTLTDKTFLWVLTPTISERILKEFNANSKENWQKGIYFLADALNTGIVAIHQLSQDKNTLWLRILGKGKIQINAIEEIKALPPNNFHRETILELIYGLLDKLETKQRQKQVKEDEVLIMSLRQIYRDKVAEIERESEQRGLQIGEQRGLQIGEQRGRQIGEQRGKLEGKLETVPLLRQLGMSVEEIATRLELPLEDVIKASHN